jgi:hypothetical protein
MPVMVGPLVLGVVSCSAGCGCGHLWLTVAGREPASGVRKPTERAAIATSQAELVA